MRNEDKALLNRISKLPACQGTIKSSLVHTSANPLWFPERHPRNPFFLLLRLTLHCSRRLWALGGCEGTPNVENKPNSSTCRTVSQINKQRSRWRGNRRENSNECCTKKVMAKDMARVYSSEFSVWLQQQTDDFGSTNL
ncbi:hypothetical protein INR49_011799 [Caranx melampygus]|nr:hypothetical protein INR49_011799 [Caranx melampygus]